MASSDNQSLQIALIVFVILTIILSVTTFLFYRGWSDASAEAEAESDRALQAQNGVRTAQDGIQQLLTVIGGPATGTSPQDVQAASDAFQTQQTSMLDTFGADFQNLTDGMNILSNSLRDTSTRLAAEEQKVRVLTEQHEAREAISQTRIDQFEAEANEAKQALESEQTAYDQHRREIEQQKSELATRNANLQEQLRAEKEKYANESQAWREDKGNLTALVDSLKSTIDDLTNEEFELADGEIRKVNQRSGVVWINLGRAHFLRPQVTFSVYGPDATNVRQLTRKGAIEVIRIIDDNLAEARIVEESIFDPLVPGDKVYTPLWHPGRQEHYAVAGWMDLDGDGQSDRRLVRDLILQSGGVIDAELDDKGNESGEMTYDTRFLVIGADKEEVEDKMGQWRNRAASLGVDTMTVNELLDMAGWRQGNRVLQYGTGSGRGYKSSQPTGDGEAPFRPRPPVAAGGFRVR